MSDDIRKPGSDPAETPPERPVRPIAPWPRHPMRRVSAWRHRGPRNAAPASN
ncbi:hypothetical protein HZF05_16365 [Sphingomonas sp. CGMCC 1.13654]|uniref:Uncharacterized protein n=1 Tax=Sphingomonas chungangi TaxID=2683589 RepID=A0A838LAP5_9SPHN|nr:hypothetical protein [Sphingomonas chungangi]MBA2935659.1 hypothetical protein [Sphingomonas chungangi]MVW54350.1 hypothetical protein [Sphingomonas chungangi]